MANIKFSAFTQKAVTGNVDFLVGYTGGDNVRISPAIFSDTYLPLAGGTMTGVVGVVVPDNFKWNFGTGSDLQIFHNATDSIIYNGTGGLMLRGADIRMQASDGGETMATFTDNGAVDLYYDNVKKFETEAGGVIISSGNYLSWGTSGVTAIEGSTVSNKMAFRTLSTERMRIDSLGNIGIGTITPDTKLHIEGGSAVTGAFYDGSTVLTIEDINPYVQIIGDDGGNQASSLILTTVPVAGTGNNKNWALQHRGTTQSGNFGISYDVTTASGQDGADGTDLFVIETGGNIGIGTISPSRKLDVRDSSDSQSTVLAYNQGASFTGTVYEAITDRTSNSAFNLMNLKASTVSKFLVRGDGNVGIGTVNVNRSGLGVDHTVLTVGTDAGMGMLELQGTRTSDADLGRIAWLNAGTRRSEIVVSRIDEDTSTKMSFSTSNAGSLSTKMTIAKDGNVGIGVNASDYWANASNLVVGGLGAVSGITIATDGNLTGSLIFADGTGAGDNTRGGLQYDHSADDMIFRVDDAERMRINSDGVVILNPTNDADGGFINSYRGAISVSTSAVGISKVATYGGLAMVWMNSAGNIAYDLVSYSLSQVTVLSSQAISGGAASRTYTAVSGILKVAMGSGTYDVYATEMRTANS